MKRLETFQLQRSFDIVIGCDTVIEFKNEVIGKPRSDEDALRVLKMLAGNTHRLFSYQIKHLFNSRLSYGSNVNRL